MTTRKSKKPRVSKVKKGNQKRTKLAKQGKLKQKRHKKPQPTQKKPQEGRRRDEEEEEEEESDHGEGMLGMVEDDDLAFLKTAVNSRSYSMLKNIRYKTNDPAERRQHKKRSAEEDDDLEGHYEDEASRSGVKKTRLMLPIKTKHGLVRRTAEAEDVEDETDVKKEAKTEEGGNSDNDLEELEDDGTGLDLSEPVSTARLLALRDETLRNRKFLIGVLASGILEAPEEKNKSFLRLLDMLDEPNPEISITVRKLAAVSLLEVFKDLLPAYQIKPIEPTGVKLKKATLVLQGFEKSLLKNYKTYLQKMENMASVLVKKRGDNRVRSLQELKLAEVAVKCLCELLVTHPYFNFSKNLAQLLVLYLDNRRVSVRQLCADSFRTVFKEDRKGEITLHVVRRINRMVKAKSHAVHCEVLTVLLSLRIKDVNLDKEKEIEIKQKKFMNHKQKLLSLSKNERKRSKKLEEVEKEMLETKAEENKQSKQQNLTEITKTVFTIYFRILKKDPSSRLLSATLEGLAKFSHCINLDFYHDLVTVLDQLMEGGTLGCREQLHCVQTVFTILSGQGDVLTIDPLRFYAHLYRNLLAVTAGRNHADLAIVVRTLEHVLIRRRKKISHQRLLAFAKRLSLLATQVLHNGSLACLGLLRNILHLNKAVDVLLDTDSSGGQGAYRPDLDDPEYCNAANSALWELAALRRHYHPVVRQFAANVLAGVPASGAGSVPTEYAKLSPEDLLREFDPSETKFNPSIPIVKQNIRVKKNKAVAKSHMDGYFKQNEDVIVKQYNALESIDFFSAWSRLCSVKIEAESDVDIDENLNFFTTEA